MKMNLKKFMSILLIITMLITAGCSTTSETTDSNNDTNSNNTTEDAKPKEQVTLRLWGGVPAENGFQTVMDNFNEEFKDKNIQIEYTRYVNDDAGNLQLETALLADDAVDIYFTYGPDRRVKRAESGFALDLTDLMERDNYDIVGKMGEIVKNNYVNGAPFSLPTTVTSACMLVNKDMFDEAGIPLPTDWTWDEYLEISKKLSSGEGQSRVYGSFLDNNWLPGITVRAMNSIGDDAYYKEGGLESNFDHPAFAKALNVATTMMHVDKSTPLYSDVITQEFTPYSMFLNEQVAIVGNEWITRYIKDTETYPHDFVTAAVPFPSLNKEDEYYTQGGAADDIMINSESNHIDEAWEFVKWYADGGMLPVAEFGRFPLNVDIRAEDTMGLFLDGVEHLFDLDSMSKYYFANDLNYYSQSIQTNTPEIAQIISEEVEAAYMGQKTADEALAEMKTRSDKLITESLE